MPVPEKPITWWVSKLKESSISRTLDVLGSDYVNNRTITRDFEKSIANLLSIKYVVGITSGAATS